MFTLTEQQELIRNLVREFAVSQVAPIACEIDDEARWPAETIKAMTALDLMGIPFPEQYGGSGGDYLSYIITVEELSRACASTGVILSAHISLAGAPIYQFGTEAQKQQYLPDLAAGRKLGAFCLTEPAAGTDAASQTTVAELDGDDYVLNGGKCFITNGDHAETFIVLAMTDKAKGTKGISAFIVEKAFAGVSVGKHERKMGIRAAHTTEVLFRNARVPKANLLGKEGDGFKIAMVTLDGGRIGIAAQALGIAQASLDESIKWAKERQQFGKPIAANQAIQFMIADMAVQVQAARHLVYHAATLKGEGKPYSKEAAMAKLFAAETAMQQSIKAVQIHGGYGYIKGTTVERLMRDAKITEIYEGTSEVQRMVISASVLR
ncbi:MAG TPA: acyl-CoA dehydrogenase [Symbiobacteriaceae bacterium]|jgi:butyryl-CoA dehydrogenase